MVATTMLNVIKLHFYYEFPSETGIDNYLISLLKICIDLILAQIFYSRCTKAVI